MSKWVGVLWVHLFGSWGFVGDEFRDKPARNSYVSGGFIIGEIVILLGSIKHRDIEQHYTLKCVAL